MEKKKPNHKDAGTKLILNTKTQRHKVAIAEGKISP
jgi:hypothetical protein